MRPDARWTSQPLYGSRPISLAPPSRGLWLTLLWPGLRMMLKVLSIPLALFVGFPAGLFTLACMERGIHLLVSGASLQAAKMFAIAWVCGSVAALAFWPRRL